MVVVVAQPWPPLSPWLSPGAAWFIFFNAVVAAIVIMSSGRQDDGHVPSSRRKLCRSASSVFLDELRSFSLFSVHPTAGGVTGPLLDDVSDSGLCFCWQEAEMVPAPQVTQASTMFTETPRPTAGECVGTAASAVVPPLTGSAAMVMVSADSELVLESKDDDDAGEEQGKSISLDEAYAMIQQSCRWQPPSAPAATTTAAKKDLAAAKVPKRRARSSRQEAEAAVEGKAELNARAELFIRQFREDLKLQRLNSLLGHMHAFGTRGGAPTAVR